MREFELTEGDRKLIQSARDIIRKRYREHWHSVGSALRTADGEVFVSVHINANVGRIAVCAEPIALANAVLAGKNSFDTIVAVQRVSRDIDEYEIVSPCGMCREIITDYDPGTKVIIKVDGNVRKVLMMDLLPYKYGI